MPIAMYAGQIFVNISAKLMGVTGSSPSSLPSHALSSDPSLTGSPSSPRFPRRPRRAAGTPAWRCTSPTASSAVPQPPPGSIRTWLSAGFEQFVPAARVWEPVELVPESVYVITRPLGLLLVKVNVQDRFV